MKNIFFLSLLIPLFTFATIKPDPKVKWVSFEEAVELTKANPKPILIDVYTTWCGWCKKLDKDVYGNGTIADYLNHNFYAVKLDAQQKEPITYNGKTFKNTGKYNQFAVALLEGKLSFPTTMILNSDVEILNNLPGYIPKERMEMILHYVKTQKYKDTEWEAFTKNFESQL